MRRVLHLSGLQILNHWATSSPFRRYEVRCWFHRGRLVARFLYGYSISELADGWLAKVEVEDELRLAMNAGRGTE